MILYAPPPFETTCKQSPQQRRRTNRFALAVFMLTALAGLAVKYLP